MEGKEREREREPSSLCKQQPLPMHQPFYSYIIRALPLPKKTPVFDLDCALLSILIDIWVLDLRCFRYGHGWIPLAPTNPNPWNMVIILILMWTPYTNLHYNIHNRTPHNARSYINIKLAQCVWRWLESSRKEGLANGNGNGMSELMLPLPWRWSCTIRVY